MIRLSFLFAQLDVQDQANLDAGPIPAIFGVITLALLVLMLAGLWKVFTKAGQPGWAAIIPIVNIYFLLKVINRPGWCSCCS